MVMKLSGQRTDRQIQVSEIKSGQKSLEHII